jgi:hypothetical protein
VNRSETLELFLLGYDQEIPCNGEGRATAFIPLWEAGKKKYEKCEMQDLLDALYNLQPNHVELIKWINPGAPEGMQRVVFDRNPVTGGWKDFFLVGQFKIKTLPGGQIRFDELTEKLETQYISSADGDDRKFAHMASVDTRASRRIPDSESKGSRRKTARTALVLNVLVASPADVSQERSVVADVIHAWNAAHYQTTGTMLHAVRWETHSYPASGDRPQAILNKQIVESGDILIGIFGYTLGTPSGTALSGTIEEIEEFRKAGKHVALYFSTADVPRTADRDQLKALEDFRRERRNDTLYGTFGTPEELRLLVTQHLPKIVAEVSAGLEDPASAAEWAQALSNTDVRAALLHTNRDLSPKEIELLWNAVKSPSPDILHKCTFDGESIRINGKQFLENANARTVAEWVAAFRSLNDRRLIEPLSYGSDFFQVTSDGYRAADNLDGFARWDARSIALRARYINAPNDEVTVSCTGIIAIPPRYFEHRVRTDRSVQRSLKEPRTLLVEGIDSNLALAWNPTELEFFDNSSGHTQEFQVGGIEFLEPGSLKLPIVV